MPPQFHIETGGRSKEKVGENYKRGFAEAIQRAIEHGVAMADEDKEKLNTREVDKEVAKDQVDPKTPPPAGCLSCFTCIECSETSRSASRRQVYLHYAVNHCQEKVALPSIKNNHHPIHHGKK